MNLARHSRAGGNPVDNPSTCKAGQHPYLVRFAEHLSLLDSRLRGNDGASI